METELWFPPRDKLKHQSIAQRSKAVCYGKDGLPECPVRKECLLYAVEMDEQHGVWGGKSHRERNALERKAANAGISFKEWVETRKS